ncbi:hypothetical protein Ae201684P_007940 [Aphanomyces euteiches]|uniref:No apical meristem-associated C-terminal domain-containing protein n=1 Tax=Aphanomyces euteiches TaxID=100861 RepID=A0A6G0WM89_9STRA|nr:hypothetical protein Ae201684_013800 [Aphanomyces euteiches]KAH9080854.1 hypothetical protein Ae201684P_007940 [Aphanomyces euteiches]KAH9138823.1 hypothetical protein AeRB84_016877 [Aphanomyces euteiches]
MGRGVKWTHIEDAQLARSWVNVSEDPIKGVDQSSDSFWGAIYVRWIAAGCEERSTQALKNRWAILNRATQKFAGYLSQVKARKASGKTDEDNIQDAFGLYLSLEHEVFEHECVWRVLGACVKWRQVPVSHKVKPISTHANDDEVEAPENANLARPILRKAAEDFGVLQRLDKLVRVQEEKNDLFADYMLLQALMQSNSERNNEAIEQLVLKLSKRRTSVMNNNIVEG